MADLTITLIQSQLHWEDIPANLAMFNDKMNEVPDEAQLVILPEMFNTGFSMQVEKTQEIMDGRTMEWMARKAREKDAVLVGSLVIKEGDHFYNRLVWMKPDGKYRTYDKRHLFRLGQEHENFTKGNDRWIEELNGWRICPMICFDLRFPVWCRNDDELDYDLILFIANWPERRSFHWRQLLIGRAIENQCYVAGVNRVGDDGNGVYHSGDSAVHNPLGGEIVKQSHDEVVTTVTLAKEKIAEVREKFPFLLDRESFHFT
jgi:predicted amidohydrolase